MAEVREVRVEVAGVGAPVLEAGPSEKTEAVVFVHGNPCSSEDWRALVAGTGDFARAVAPDLPNFGRADRRADFDVTLEGYARWLDGALGELGVQRAHLVLHDWGGGIGFMWATEQPERVASLTLCNVGVQRGYRWHSAARVWRIPVVGEALQAITTRDLLETIKRHKPTVADWFQTARNHALYANQSGLYDDILAYMKISK